MNARTWRRALIVGLIGTAVAAGSSAPASAEPARVDGDAAVAAGEDGSASPANTIVALPDLGITHRLADGGMNLWRMPLSDLEQGYGEPALVKRLNYGGFAYGSSKTLTGDFADVSASDDGTADHVIWHAQPNGGVLVWAVGGGGDTAPRLWHDLRTGGWSYAASRPMVGDVTGDGWDDLVVLHASGNYDNIWVFPSDGQRLGAPQLWRYMMRYDAWPVRWSLADLTGDGVSELLGVNTADWYGPTMYYEAVTLAPGGAYTYGESVFTPVGGAGWSSPGSRQAAGDVTGDGLPDLVTVHAQAGGGMLVWMHENCSDGTFFCFADPVVWQNLKTGGWSFAGSKQGLADTDGDGILDLVSVHQQSGNPGMLVWRHRSTGAGLLTPEVMSDLRVGGWSYTSSRVAIADTYGVLVN